MNKKVWQGCQSESASIAWFDWIQFSVTTILDLSSQIWIFDYLRFVQNAEMNVEKGDVKHNW